MKKGITFYIDDDVDMIAFCGTLCTQIKDTDEPIRGVTMLNLSIDDIKECAEWYIPVNGKAEPYQSENPTGAEGSEGMTCDKCKHFKILYEPLRTEGKLWDLGRAKCEKHNKITDFANHGKFKRLDTCDDFEPQEEGSEE